MHFTKYVNFNFPHKMDFPSTHVTYCSETVFVQRLTLLHEITIDRENLQRPQRTAYWAADLHRLQTIYRQALKAYE